LVVTATEEKDRGGRKESSGRSEEARKRGSEERKNNPISNATVLTRERARAVRRRQETADKAVEGVWLTLGEELGSGDARVEERRTSYSSI
jgi:hypothetical protein